MLFERKVDGNKETEYHFEPWKRIYLITLAKMDICSWLKKSNNYQVNFRKSYFQTVKINSY